MTKFTYHRPGGKVDILEAVCIPCGCVSGYGRPPAVGECACHCHDTARLWWSMRPWRLDLDEPCLSRGHDWVDIITLAEKTTRITRCNLCGAVP
jgi:hypothetical protein